MADENAGPAQPLQEEQSGLKDIDGAALAVANIDQVQADRTPVGHAAELGTKAAEVAAWLANTDSWVDQARALKTIQFLVKECGVHHVDGFTAAYAQWVEGINACVDNLRSALVKEASLTIMDVASETKGAFGAFAAQHFPPLLRVSARTKQVMARSVLKCMKHLVELCPPDSLVACYKALDKADAHQIRAAKADCLLSLLQEHAHDAIAPVIADVEEALVLVLQDSKPKTRQLGTSAFKVFLLKFPDRRDGVLDRLDPPTRKRLDPTPQRGLKQRVQSIMERDFKGLFKLLDANGDGIVSVEEVMATLKLSEDEATAFIKAGDDNGDGYVDFDEFVKVMSAINLGNSTVQLVGKLLTLKLKVVAGRRPSLREPAPPEPRRLASLVSYEDKDEGNDNARDKEGQQAARVPPVRESGGGEEDADHKAQRDSAGEMPPPATPKGGKASDSAPPQEGEEDKPLASHRNKNDNDGGEGDGMADDPLWSGPVLVRSGKFGGLCRGPRFWMEVRPASVAVFKAKGQEHPLDVLRFVDFVVSQKNVTVLMHPKTAGHHQLFEFSFVSRNASNHFAAIRKDYPDAHSP